MSAWQRHRAATAPEDGFSLVEIIVAVTLAAVLLTGGAHVLGSSLKAAVFARNNTQAAELLSETIERLRSSNYASVAMIDTDVAGDAAVTGAAPAYTFDPDGSGPLTAEPVVTAATGAVSPHVTTVTRNAQRYTLRTYVTRPNDLTVPGATYKRITVQAVWTVGGNVHERQASSVLTPTRRGLPLPNFHVVATAGDPTEPITVNAGAELVLPFNVVNRGARDAFNLGISSAPSTTASFTFHDDNGAAGAYEIPGDTAAVDSDNDGDGDTGVMEVDETAPMLARATVPASAVAGRYSFTVTGTSSGQPTAGGAVRSDTFTVDIVSDTTCVGCTYRPVYLRNQYPACTVEPCDTTRQEAMPLRTEAPTAPSLGNFDTEVDLGPGRLIRRAVTTPESTTTDGAYVATFRYAMAQSTTFTGDIIVDLPVAVAGAGTTPGSSLPVGVTVYVSRSTSGSGATTLVSQGSDHYGALGTTAFHPMRIRIPVSTTVANNRFLELKIVVDSATSETDVWLGYDAVTENAVAYLPVAG